MSSSLLSIKMWKHDFGKENVSLRAHTLMFSGDKKDILTGVMEKLVNNQLVFNDLSVEPGFYPLYCKY